MRLPLRWQSSPCGPRNFLTLSHWGWNWTLRLTEGVSGQLHCAVRERHRPNLERCEVKHLKDDVTLEPKAEVARRSVHHGVQDFFAEEFVAHHSNGIDWRGQTISLTVVEDAHRGAAFFLSRQN